MRTRASVVRSVARELAGVLLLVGLGCFLGQGCVSVSGLGGLRGAAWPVGRTTEAIRLPDGRYAVPLEHVGRVQVYSPDLRFQHGWQVDAFGGAFTLLSAPGGRLQVYTARGNRWFLFEPDGRVVTQRTYDRTAEPYPDRAPHAVTVTIPWRWWTFPLLGPFYAWGIAFAGVALLLATRTREERLADRQRAARRRPVFGDKTRRAVATAGGWILAVAWVLIGLVWTVGAAAGLATAAFERNVVGTLILIPVVAIGCAIVYGGMGIARRAYRATSRRMGRGLGRTRPVRVSSRHGERSGD